MAIEAAQLFFVARRDAGSHLLGETSYLWHPRDAQRLRSWYGINGFRARNLHFGASFRHHLRRKLWLEAMHSLMNYSISSWVVEVSDQNNTLLTMTIEPARILLARVRITQELVLFF